jgi:peptide-methionine (R)-S-oxide reductase
MDPAKRPSKGWRKDLTEEQYRVLRDKGTEMPFTGKYVGNKEPGMYRCAGCGALLFSSDKKFDSGTGWPSFDEAIPESVRFIHDDAHGMARTEVVCANCGGHLGHIFDDGPKATTGKRYCINSVCLEFESEADIK